MDAKQLVEAQALKYAEELQTLYREERGQRERAESALAEVQRSYAATVRGLAAALELRDDLTGGHAERAAGLALHLTRRVAPELAARPELEYGYLLHDIGKIGIPDAILLKRGKLTDEEFDVMRSHPELGEGIIREVPYLQGLPREVILHHHERWDGRGYPHRLVGAEIPLPARIFALVDAWDAMTNDRPYRLAMPVKAAASEIGADGGRQFDSALVEPFLELALSGDGS
jgi:HD-GYP domain-containing protein (c-di-GMP phosphodiesterase class II)